MKIKSLQNFVFENYIDDKPVFKLVNSKLVLAILGPFLCFPAVPFQLFNISILTSIFLTIILSVFGGNFIYPLIKAIQSPTLDNLYGSVIFDPLIIHLFTAIICSVLIFFSARIVKGNEKWSRIIAIFLPFVILGIMLLIGDNLIKPAFSVQRPLSRLQEPFVTKFIRGIISNNHEGAPTSMPSGFVMRQIGLFWIVNWMVFERRAKNRYPKIVRISIFSINLFLLIMVCFARIYGESHTLLDVFVAIGVGTLLFWLIVLPINNLISIKGFRIHTVHLSTIGISSLFLFFVVLGFSNSGGELVKLFVYEMLFLGIITVLSPSFLIEGISWKYSWQSTEQKKKK